MAVGGTGFTAKSAPGFVSWCFECKVSEGEGFGDFQTCPLVTAAVESVWCGRVVLSKLWSVDGIACGGGSSTGYNTNYQWICESGTAWIESTMNQK